jgi:hypothetical protein
MDSGLGSIGRKIIKLVRRIAIGVFRRRGMIATGNALGLVTTGYILHSHFRADAVGHLVFENEWLSSLAQWGIYVIPALLLFNSFLFQKLWKMIVSAVVSAILTFRVLCILPVIFLILALGGFNDTLIRQTRTPDGQIISLYDELDGGFAPGDNRHCRYRIRRSKVFRGVLRNEDIGEKVCRPTGGKFPPELQ